MDEEEFFDENFFVYLDFNQEPIKIVEVYDSNDDPKIELDAAGLELAKQLFG